MVWMMFLITIASIVVAVHKKKPIALAAPIAILFVFFIVEVALVPLSFTDTIKFIFSLQ